MARPSKTGIKGLHKDRRGRWCIDFRYRDPATRELRRYTEDLPPGITAAAAKERARLALNAAYAGDICRIGEPTQLHASLDQYLKWCETNRPKTIADRRHFVDVLNRHLGAISLSDLSPFTAMSLSVLKLESGG